MALGAVGTQVARAIGLADAAGSSLSDPLGRTGWGSRLPVAQLALDSVGLASLAIARAATPEPVPIRVDARRVAASFGSDRILRLDGRPPAAWAPLSRFWRAADGWVRTHANYPHHERALRTLLQVSADADADAVAAVIARRSAVDLEDRAAGAGAVVGAVRSREEWRALPPRGAVAAAPIVDVRRTGEARTRAPLALDRPLAGVRVLDLTRVLAGPVAARDLALAGADVLRVDSPALPETEWIHLDTGQGKRSTLLDLRDRHDRAALDALLRNADVVLSGYRPGALARFGIDPHQLALRHPGLVTASVSAWGSAGPWAGRRGFDSVVQAATGIAQIESPDGDTPGALPVQALDHSTGHFLAAAIVAALVRQRHEGGSFDVRMSLARVAEALLDAPPAPHGGDADPGPLPAITRTVGRPGLRTLTYAPPALAHPGAPADYDRVGDPWGVDPPAWAAAADR